MSIFDLVGGALAPTRDLRIFTQQMQLDPVQDGNMRQLASLLMAQPTKRPLFHCARAMVEYEDQVLGIKF